MKKYKLLYNKILAATRLHHCGPPPLFIYGGVHLKTVMMLLDAELLEPNAGCACKAGLSALKHYMFMLVKTVLNAGIIVKKLFKSLFTFLPK
jgi:hypothetical protein